jgi:hypothetical protein
MLTSPRTVRKISHSSVLAEQGRLISFPNVHPERGEPLTLRDAWRLWTSFRLGRVFSSLLNCLRRKTRASARLTGPVLVPCAPRGFTSTQDAARRTATSRARAGCKFVLSPLLATIALLAASMVSAHAQTREWTGRFSSEWFLSGNWDSTFPRRTDDAIINTATPNSTVISSSGAEAHNLAVGENGTGMLTIQSGGHWSTS